MWPFKKKAKKSGYPPIQPGYYKMYQHYVDQQPILSGDDAMKKISEIVDKRKEDILRRREEAERPLGVEKERFYNEFDERAKKLLKVAMKCRENDINIRMFTEQFKYWSVDAYKEDMEDIKAAGVDISGANPDKYEDPLHGIRFGIINDNLIGNPVHSIQFINKDGSKLQLWDFDPPNRMRLDVGGVFSQPNTPVLELQAALLREFLEYYENFEQSFYKYINYIIDKEGGKL